MYVGHKLNLLEENCFQLILTIFISRHIQKDLRFREAATAHKDKYFQLFSSRTAALVDVLDKESSIYPFLMSFTLTTCFN